MKSSMPEDKELSATEVAKLEYTGELEIEGVQIVWGRLVI